MDKKVEIITKNHIMSMESTKKGKDKIEDITDLGYCLASLLISAMASMAISMSASVLWYPGLKRSALWISIPSAA
jgi:hypothetical protein